MTTTRRQLLLASTAIAASATPGCAYLRPFLRTAVREPVVRVKDFFVKSWTLSHAKAVLDVSIKNPNRVALDLAKLAHALTLDGRPVAAGGSLGGLSVKANGTSTAKILLDFDIANTSKALMTLLTRGKVPYGLKTTFGFKTPIGNISVPVRHQGELPLPKLPEVRQPGIVVKGIGLSGVDFELSANVYNPNTFTLPIDGADFDVTLNGNEVVSHAPISGLSVGAKATRRIRLPFKVGLPELGLTAASLFTSPTLRWGIKGNVAAGVLKLPVRHSGRIQLAR